MNPRELHSLNQALQYMTERYAWQPTFGNGEEFQTKSRGDTILDAIMQMGPVDMGMEDIVMHRLFNGPPSSGMSMCSSSLARLGSSHIIPVEPTFRASNGNMTIYDEVPDVDFDKAVQTYAANMVHEVCDLSNDVLIAWPPRDLPLLLRNDTGSDANNEETDSMPELTGPEEEDEPRAREVYIQQDGGKKIQRLS
jgi:hypothetical protein